MVTGRKLKAFELKDSFGEHMGVPEMCTTFGARNGGH